MAKRKASSRRARREPEEGYIWVSGGRRQEKDPLHPRWTNERNSGEEDAEITRIADHSNNDDGNKRLCIDEKVKKWSDGIRVDMTAEEFGLHLLEIGWDVVQSKDYLVGAVKSMAEELGVSVGDVASVIPESAQPAVEQAMTPKGLKDTDTNVVVSWDSNAYFTSKKDGETCLSYTAAASSKSRDMARIDKAMKICGTVPHASVAIHQYLTKVEPQIGVNLGVVRNPDQFVAVASDLLRQIKLALHSPRVHQKNTNDAISLQKTLFSIIIPPAPIDTATKEEISKHTIVMKQIVSQLGVTGGTKTRLIDSSKEKRDLLNSDTETIMETKLIKVHRRKEHSNRVVTPEFLDQFKEYLLTCEVTYDSPNRKDCVFAKDFDGNRIIDELNGGYLKARNRYYQRGLGWLYKHATKPVDEGGYTGFRDADGNICISQTTMERMMPHNYKRMTNTLKSSCRCASCLDAEYLHQDLSSWRNQNLKDLGKDIAVRTTWIEENQDARGTSTYEIRERQLIGLKQELVDFKTDVFKVGVDGKLYQKLLTMEDALDLMTCAKVGPSDCFGGSGPPKFQKYKCCLGRCDECPTLPPNRGEHHTEDRMVLWRKHEHRNWCKLHGAIETGKCAECLSLPESNRPNETPRKTYDAVKKTAPILEFIENHYAKYNTDVYRQHCFLRRALGKNWCKRLRDPFVLFLLEQHRKDVNAILDFADRMACEYNNTTMTEGMGGSAKNIGMEGCCYHLFNEFLGEVERHWFGFLSDEKQQDARICFVNRCKFIESMQKNGKLTEGSTLWLQTDGCGKQYKCHNFMQMHVLLAKFYKIKIDVMITTAGHGKCLVDSLAGTDKHHLDKGRISELDSTRVDEHQRAKSEAHKACIFLGSVDRMLGSYKHSRQTKDQFEVKSRQYTVTNYDVTKTEVEARSIPFKNTNFGPVAGWKPGTKNGIKEMYHFRFDYRIAGNIGMARRIPCACKHCTETLDKPWIGLDRNPEIARSQHAPVRVHPKDQPSYQQPQDCVFRDLMMDGKEDLNMWHFVELAPTADKCDDSELDEFFSFAMSTKTKAVESEIEVGGIGALSATTDKKEHGFYLMEWTKKPHTLQSPSKVFGMKDKVAAGQVVCEGVFWSRVDHSNDWYEPQESSPKKRPKKILVLLTQVLCGKVCYKGYLAGIIVPPRSARVSSYNRYNMAKLIRLGAEELDFLQKEQLQREGFELIALDKIGKKRKRTTASPHESSHSDSEDDEYIDNTWEHPDY